MLLIIRDSFILAAFFALSCLLFPAQAHPGHDDASEGHATTGGHTGTLASGNVGLAFGLAAISGVCSAVGSLLPFLDDLAVRMGWAFRITNSPSFLARSFGFSSGVLLFLTLGDLFPEAIQDFKSSGSIPTQHASLLATAVFIVGVLIVMLVKKVLGRRASHHQDGSSVDGGHSNPTVENHVIEIKGPQSNGEQVHQPQVQSRGDFKALGWQIAGALAVHNFPEGLATFTTTLASAKIGVMFGIALALHKFPEGMMIVLPIYYATNSRWISFLIAAGVGIATQLLGALLGYVLFVTYWNQAISATLLALASGVLLYTVINGMLPMARRYDPEDKYVSFWVFLGLWFFALVAALFSYA
ncbi:Zip-domain-containing protein [Basidiobolus meristosporus CBS 931.73]|uniref:Zip-domain-containing protein n=1 Tax=Basidiobolus meristosporus CBS 931.73 TaxID=1314790 RepID=A0A1Y1YRM3_9FUNG|nr:Zip-domain-containing protein [Basidiobolus meristosporus CBS 931.73]|eukprot:ORY00688.1 Zip-domain-containing protein [Basidiobolus meristosporus CBS 931.73]